LFRAQEANRLAAGSRGGRIFKGREHSLKSGDRSPEIDRHRRRPFAELPRLIFSFIY
jgi:hypothetical protein